MHNFPLSLAIAGSTQHTVLCAESLRSDTRFQIAWVLTPSPRLVGRKQILTKNPLHLWAEQHHIPLIFVEQKLDETVRTTIESLSKQIDLLLVVDFGYLIPNWLLAAPKIAPLNIHPSDLPKYRGSSPGQYTLLYGEKNSAVSVIVMNEKLDEGDLIYQAKFPVLSTWNAQDFYQFAFTSISEKLANVLADFASGSIQPKSQPHASPTPIAGRFSRSDGFVDWSLLSGGDVGNTSPLLKQVHEKIQNWPQVIANAVRALYPWPGVWSLIDTDKGEKRMKILSTEVKGGKLVIGQVQLEGEKPSDILSLKI